MNKFCIFLCLLAGVNFQHAKAHQVCRPAPSSTTITINFSLIKVMSSGEETSSSSTQQSDSSAVETASILNELEPFESSCLRTLGVSLATVPSLGAGLMGHTIDIAKLPLWNFLLVSVGHHLLQEKLGINPTPSFLTAASMGAIIYHGDNSAALREIKASYEALTALARGYRKQYAGIKTLDTYIHHLESDLWGSFKEYPTLWKFGLASATLITAGLYFNPTHSAQ